MQDKMHLRSIMYDYNVNTFFDMYLITRKK